MNQIASTMKTILYMGITVNGYIAKTDGNSEWTSEENLQGFYEQSKRAGNIIMGANTYRAALEYGYFPFPDTLNVVVTYQKMENRWGDEKAIFTDKSPKEILSFLESKGFTTAFLAGGGRLNSAFAKENLIDEIYLDVEPFAFGNGISVFAESDFELELKLLEVNKLNPNTVQLHYEVIK